MKHHKTIESLDKFEVGEYFTFEIITDKRILYKKALKISHKFMVPVGIACETIENAQKQN